MSKIISIKETVKTPSHALECMIAGLIKQSERSDFKIDMGDYGDFNPSDKKCFGCAATCTIQEIAKKDFIDDRIVYVGTRATYLGFNQDELWQFENAIDSARQGEMEDLFKFFELPSELMSTLFEMDMFNTTWHLNSRNWAGGIDEIKDYIRELKKLGY